MSLKLDGDSLDWAKAHACFLGDTDVFPLPFEYQAIDHDWDHVKDYLISQDVCAWAARPHRTLLAPKGRLGFRPITQLDPLDFLIFAAVVYEIGDDIEEARIDESAKTVFSYRFHPTDDGLLFDPMVGYGAFVEQTITVLDDLPDGSHVAVTDISDFYHRIYHHRLENALNAATEKSDHKAALRKLLSQWNRTETYGIPVGNAPSRMLAEITISDVDEALLANGIRYVRFNDDYRIFADSYAEAYRHLAFLAEILFSNHGLTLQPRKTDIVDKELFRERYLPGPSDKELTSLQQKFQELVVELDLADPYEEIDLDDLTPEQLEIVNSLNLVELFHDEMAATQEPDANVLRFVLRRLAQLGDASLVEELLSNLDLLHPVFADVIRYFTRLRGLNKRDRKSIGSKVLALLQDSIVSELDYHRMWGLSLFTESTEWDSEKQFPKLYGAAIDSASRRKLILAMGRAGHRFWFKSQWRALDDHPPWCRRALLAGASCLPSDARKHWYKSKPGSLDVLEEAVVAWARANPFA